MHPLQMDKHDIPAPLLSVQVHTVHMDIGIGVAWPGGSGDSSMMSEAQHQTFLEKHVEAQHREPEGHGFLNYACQLGHLEREKC